jgi:hypothetical protein
MHVSQCLTCIERRGAHARRNAVWEERGLLRRLVRVDDR